MHKILYHKLVLKDDFKSIPEADRRKIAKAIRKKLSKEPEVFGKALRKELKGYSRLRADFYRVIYRVDRGRVVVLIIKVGLRKDMKVYIEAAKRLGLL